MPGEKEEYLPKQTSIKLKNQDHFIFGAWPIVEALKEGKEFNKILLQKGNKSETTAQIVALCKERAIPVQYVPVQKLNGLTRKNHQGVVAFVSPIEYQTIESVLPLLYEEGKEPFILVLDRITDVRNFGAICRTAEGAGVDAIIIPTKDAAQINADAIKTSAGAVFNIPICRETSLISSVYYLKESGLQIVGCTEKGAQDFRTVKLDGPSALIMGSEENGIDDKILGLCDYKAVIPMKGKTESLNVSVACGILLYHLEQFKA